MRRIERVALFGVWAGDQRDQREEQWGECDGGVRLSPKGTVLVRVASVADHVWHWVERVGRCFGVS